MRLLKGLKEGRMIFFSLREKMGGKRKYFRTLFEDVCCLPEMGQMEKAIGKIMKMRHVIIGWFRRRMERLRFMGI